MAIDVNYEINDISVQAYGEPLLSYGLYNRSSINGIGLVTRGFLWETQDIWLDTTFVSQLSTTWVVGSSVSSTSWVVGSSVSSTSWNDVQYGIWGDSQN